APQRPKNRRRKNRQQKTSKTDTPPASGECRVLTLPQNVNESCLWRVALLTAISSAKSRSATKTYCFCEEPRRAIFSSPQHAEDLLPTSPISPDARSDRYRPTNVRLD